MFKVINKNFYVTRGDKGSFDVDFDDYTFVSGDKLTLRVYEAEGLDQSPVLSKTVTVSESTEIVTINLTAAETAIGDIENEVTTYWYEVDLNEEQTVFCYDETGPRLFYLYPGGKH